MSTPLRLAFSLGRHPKISLAEIFALFPHASYETVTEKYVVISGITAEAARALFPHMGGSIRLMQIIDTIASFEEFCHRVSSELTRHGAVSKLDYALGALGVQVPLFKSALAIKRRTEKSLRCANVGDENLSAAAFKKSKLDTTGTEFFFLRNPSGEHYIAQTLVCQDVDSYAERDMQRMRDMKIGMLPPKLAQMMINIATKWDTSLAVYDPFCGLGTILTESATMGHITLFGSDVNPAMVEATTNNLSTFTLRHSRIFQKSVESISLSEDVRSDVVIVSEWYLGKMFLPTTISLEKVSIERRALASMYTQLFQRLASERHCKRIVISFPFWEIATKYHFFEEIYDILKRTKWSAEALLPADTPLTVTKTGSLLYKRPDQSVGREIFSLVKA